MRKLAIVGAGGQAVEAIEAARSEGRWNITGLYVEKNYYTAGTVLGLPVYPIDDIPHKRACIIAIAQPETRIMIAAYLSGSVEFVAVQHSTAQVGFETQVGPGTLISAGCIISARVKIKKHVMIGPGCIIGHDVSIHNCATVYPGAILGGFSEVSSQSQIGAGANILPKKRVGLSAVVGAGAVVTKHVKNNTTVKGVPAHV